jgi:hypothetical protein
MPPRHSVHPPSALVMEWVVDRESTDNPSEIAISGAPYPTAKFSPGLVLKHVIFNITREELRIPEFEVLSRDTR